MDDIGDSRVSRSSSEVPESDYKTMSSEDRGGEELDSGKMQHLQSAIQSEGFDTHDPETSKMEETEDHMNIVETQSSQVLDKNAAENVDLNKLSTVLVDNNSSKAPDLNGELYTDENSGYNDNVVSLGDDGMHFSDIKGKAADEHNHTYVSTSHMDLNAEDVSSSANQDPCHASRSHNRLKMRDALDCGKFTVHIEDKDALSKWKQMKQNGFMSPTYGGVPAAPKQRGRKRKSDVLKQKMEQAKKEQVDRFTKIAAPSGLLNGLNPGIINHVRNSKQVHSIIQALVRSEKQESCKQARTGSRELHEANTEPENLNIWRAHGSLISKQSGYCNSMPESKLLRESNLSYNRSPLRSSENRGGVRDSATEEGRLCAKAYFASHFRPTDEDHRLALKPSSPTIISETNSCLSTADTLSVKAATVASQWLHLLQQDIKGRLAALHRSKKRVKAVITTELPFLLAKEFSSDKENDPYTTSDSDFGGSHKAIAEMHQAKWGKFFDQMNTALSEEEKQLEEWLSEVNTMLLCCDEGLQHVQWNAVFEMQHLGALHNEFRTRVNDPGKDLSVKAAAASIYSTCNFLYSRENVSCC